MSTTYDPSDSSYFDKVDLDEELNRVYDICQGCRLCYNLCPAFPTLFDFIDKKDADVSKLDNQEKFKVVDQCYECKLCYVKCPYVPPHEWNLDFPRLMLRAKTVKAHHKENSLKERLADSIMSNTDLIGAISSKTTSLTNRLITKPETPVRKVLDFGANLAKERQLPIYSKQRFSTWWKKRGPKYKNADEKVSLFPTCFVEYMDPEIGKAFVEAAEMSNVSITVPSGTKCCGAPYLHSGDVKSFLKRAEINVERLAVDVAMEKKIVATQPTCAYVLKYDYPMYLKTDKAKQVASALVDASEYFIYLQKKGALNTDFQDAMGKEIAYHMPCHLKALSIGRKSQELLELIGLKVSIIEGCSGIDGTWGYRKNNYELSKKISNGIRSQYLKLKENAIKEICGDCHLANYSIFEETGVLPKHPVEVFRNAYKKS